MTSSPRSSTPRVTASRRSCAPRPTGSREILRAQGEGQAIQTVFQAIHDGRPDQSLLAYQYLQMMPKIAEGDANKVWIVPSEIGKALEGLGSTMNSLQGIPDEVDGPAHPRRHGRDGAGRSSRATRRDADAAGHARRSVAGGDRRPPRRPSPATSLAGAAAAVAADRPPSPGRSPPPQ